MKKFTAVLTLATMLLALFHGGVQAQKSPMLSKKYSPSTLKSDASPFYDFTVGQYHLSAGEALIPYINPSHPTVTSGQQALDHVEWVIRMGTKETVTGYNSFINKNNVAQFSWRTGTYTDCYKLASIGDWDYYVRSGCKNLVAVKVRNLDKHQKVTTQKEQEKPCDKNRILDTKHKYLDGRLALFNETECGDVFVEFVKEQQTQFQSTDTESTNIYSRPSNSNRSTQIEPWSPRVEVAPEAAPSISEGVRSGMKRGWRIALPILASSAVGVTTGLLVNKFANKTTELIVEVTPPDQTTPTPGTGTTQGPGSNGSTSIGQTGRYAQPPTYRKLRFALRYQ